MRTAPAVRDHGDEWRSRWRRGNNAHAFRLAAGTGTLAVGAPADLVVCDAPAASLAQDALDAIARGDIPGISCVVIDG